MSVAVKTVEEECLCFISIFLNLKSRGCSSYIHVKASLFHVFVLLRFNECF